MKKMKENKGFTLVELIVVLVILAILAAILVPALLGYIDRARGQQIVLNARSVYTAAQAEMSSLYGENKPASDINKDNRADRVLETAGISANGDVDPSKVTEVTIVAKAAPSTSNNRNEYKIIGVKYVENNKTIVFDGSSWIEDGTLPTGKSYTLKGSN